MALLIGVDDTDSRQGGCTTALAVPIIQLFPELAPEGAPRLVRLNPNVPWKTRGNGALALHFSGNIALREALTRVVALVEREARRDEGTSPGVVVSDTPLDPELYRAAVTRVVPRTEALLAAQRAGALWWGGRGAIGAAAALAWPAQRATWERIAYRDPSRIGTRRDVDPLMFEMVECGLLSTFDSFDLVESEIVCVPASPCPVLWGVRGLDPAELERASKLLGPERPARETLFLTNHASDDHLVERAPAEVRAFESARARGRVTAKPAERNGHVFVEVDGLRCAAYAPTKSFRTIVKLLAVGDDITVCGGAHAGPDARVTLGIEKLCIHEAVPRKLGNPLCPTCGKSMKSAGKGQGYRCHDNKATQVRTMRGPEGWFEVPAVARRHLARPLKLGEPSSLDVSLGRA